MIPRCAAIPPCTVRGAAFLRQISYDQRALQRSAWRWWQKA